MMPRDGQLYGFSSLFKSSLLNENMLTVSFSPSLLLPLSSDQYNCNNGEKYAIRRAKAVCTSQDSAFVATATTNIYYDILICTRSAIRSKRQTHETRIYGPLKTLTHRARPPPSL